MVSARASSALSRFRRWPRRSTPAAPRSRAARGSRLGSSWMAHAIAASSNGKSPSAQAPAAISTVSASSRPIRLAARSPLANFRSSTLATLPGVGNMPRKLAGRESYEVEANRRTLQRRAAGGERGAGAAQPVALIPGDGFQRDQQAGAPFDLDHGQGLSAQGQEVDLGLAGLQAEAQDP